jgi:hypothetical protein
MHLIPAGRQASDMSYLSDPCLIGHPAIGGEGVVAMYLRRLLTSETLMATSHHKKTMRTIYRVGAGLAPAQNPGPMPNTAGATARVAPTNRISRRTEIEALTRLPTVLLGGVNALHTGGYLHMKRSWRQVATRRK